jgi:amino acid transporter
MSTQASKSKQEGDRHGPKLLAGGALGSFNVLAIAVAAISPTTSVFLVYGAGLGAAGTGVIWSFIIGAVIAVSMGLCYAEVGSVYPSAGGAYTIIRKALGPVWGGLANVLFLVLGIVITASILVASASVLHSLVPALPVNWTAFAMMFVVTVLSLERISPTSWVTAAMLVLEIAVIFVFTGFTFANHSLHGDPFLHPVLSAGPGSVLTAVGIGGLMVAVVPALFAFNGYDWPLYFAEETRNAKRTLPRAVLLAVTISVVVELAAVIGATYAIKNLGVATANSSPLSLIAQQIMGSVGSKILLIGVVIAMFDTGLAGNLAYARIYYAAGRDKMLPGPLNRFFAHISPRSNVPTYGFLVLFVGNSILCIFSSLNSLITFTGVVIVLIYLLVALSALVSRVRDKKLERGLRMPLWPVPPLVAIVGVGIALSQQVARDLIITAVIVVISLVAYGFYRRSLGERLPTVQSEGVTEQGLPDVEANE